MYKLMIYPEWREKISSLTKEEKSDFFEVLFEYNDRMDLWNDPKNFTSGILSNRVIRICFDFVAPLVTKDYESFQTICKRNKDIAVERERKKREQKAPVVVYGDQSSPVGTNSNSNSNSNNINTDVLIEQAPEKKVSLFDKLKTEEEKKYWDPGINAIIDLIKNYNSGICDWTQKEQRIYWKHLIKKLEEVKKWDFTWLQVLETILKIVSQDQYHAHKISWPKKIYYELTGLLQICKNNVQHPKNSIIDFPWI